MEQHEATTFTLLYTELLPSLDELRKLMNKVIQEDMLKEIAEFRRDVASRKAEEDGTATPYEIHHNIAVDVSRFPDFEAALKKFSALSKREGLMPTQRQFARQGDRMVQRYRTGRFERTVLPVSPLVAAKIRDRRRKAMRGELDDARTRVRPNTKNTLGVGVKPREIESPALPTSEAVGAPIASIGAEQNLTITPLYSSPARRQFATGPREEVLILIEFLESAPKFALIKDQHKALIGFPFGGVDDPEQGIVGQTPLRGGLREAREEFFCGLPVMLSAGEDSMFATMPGPDGGTVHLMHLKVPAGTPYAHGGEQTHSGLFTEAQVDEIIAERLMLAKHRDAWLLFKEKILASRSC